MRILRSLVAIVAGFWFIAATQWVGTLVATTVFAPGPAALPAGYLVALLAIGTLGSLMGGWLAARAAPFAPFGHACVLAAIYAVMSFNLLMRPVDFRGLWWYLVARGVAGVLAVLIGGKLRAAAAAGSAASSQR